MELIKGLSLFLSLCCCCLFPFATLLLFWRISCCWEIVTFATIFGIRDDFEYEEGVEVNYKGD